MTRPLQSVLPRAVLASLLVTPACNGPTSEAGSIGVTHEPSSTDTGDATSNTSTTTDPGSTRTQTGGLDASTSSDGPGSEGSGQVQPGRFRATCAVLRRDASW